MSIDKNSDYYYDAGGIEVMNVIKAKLTEDQFVGFLLGNYIKHSLRLNYKNQKLSDSKKLNIYSELLKKELEYRDRSTGNCSTGNCSTGNCSTGNCSTGNHSTGNHSTGDYSTGYSSTGYSSTGYSSTGYSSTGNHSTGDNSTGYSSTGYSSTGDYSTGDYSTGNWSISNYSTGHFSTIDYSGFGAFNKPCSLETWENAIKPKFLFFGLTEFVPTEKMTDSEKKENQKHKTIWGYLKTYDYKEAFRKSFDKASENEIKQLKALPNFDAKVFKEISGIDIDV